MLSSDRLLYKVNTCKRFEIKLDELYLERLVDSVTGCYLQGISWCLPE